MHVKYTLYICGFACKCKFMYILYINNLLWKYYYFWITLHSRWVVISKMTHDFSTGGDNEAARVFKWFGCLCMHACMCVCVVFFFQHPPLPIFALLDGKIISMATNCTVLQSKLSNILCTSCKIGLFSLYLCVSSFRGYMFMQMRIVLFLSAWLNMEFVLHLGNAKPCYHGTWYTM